MDDVEDYFARSDALRQQLQDVHGVKARDLASALRKCRRDLPRALRQSGQKIVAAGAMIGHPQLEHMIDFEDLRARHDAISKHLDSVDVADIRRGKWLSFAARLASIFIIVSASFIWWMVQTGHL